MSNATVINIILTDDDIEKLKAKHGQLAAFCLARGGQRFVVRAPSADEFQIAADKMADGGRARSDAIMDCGRECLVFPSPEAIDAHMARTPGLAFTAGNLALELAGVTDGVGVKKY